MDDTGSLDIRCVYFDMYLTLLSKTIGQYKLDYSIRLILYVDDTFTRYAVGVGDVPYITIKDDRTLNFLTSNNSSILDPSN